VKPKTASKSVMRREAIQKKDEAKEEKPNYKNINGPVTAMINDKISVSGELLEVDWDNTLVCLKVGEETVWAKFILLQPCR
jgi:hypothetical protein